jgi:sulfatase maturation enzyme AslB (radical SAM superfamily)
MSKFISSDKVFCHLDQLYNWDKGKKVTPVTVELHLSNVCNNKCFYCCADKVKDMQIMTKDETLKSVEFVADLGAKGIIFSGGGEPTLSSYFEDALYWARDRGLDIGVITNGVSLNEDKQKTVLSKASWVRVSLDAHNEKLYHKIRGTHSFDSVMKNVASLLSKKEALGSKCTVGLQIVVNKYNYREVEDIALFLTREFKDIDYIQVRPVEIFPNEDGYSLDELNTIEPQLNFLRRRSKIIVSDKWDIFYNNTKKEYGFSACHCAEFIGAIDAYGDFYLCCHTIKMPEYKYCNIFKIKSTANLFVHRADTLDKLGKTQGLNPTKCFLACRGSNINRRLEGLKNGQEHANFL